MHNVVSLDFETPYGKDFSVVDLGYYKYARDERCQPYMISVCDGSEVWAGHPKDFNFDALEGKFLVSHNSSFDEEIALGAAERGLFPFPKCVDWACTANMSAYLWNVRSLADAARVGLGVEVDKGVRDRAKGKSWDDMVREGWAEDMLKYARLDAQHCYHLWAKHADKWPDWERRLSRLTIDQGRYGLRIDVPRLEQYIAELNQVIFTALNNLPWVARGRAPASPLGMAEECRAAGIPCPPVKAHDPEAAADWEDTYAPQFAWVMAVRNLRKAKKTLATLETIKLRLRPDGTVPFSLKYAGAHTLRWAGDSGWNLQNMNKEPLFILPNKTFELASANLKTLNKLFDKDPALVTDAIPLDIRGLIIARPGMKLAPTDLAQIEPRVLNWLAGNFALLSRIAMGMSIYEAFARDSMGWTGGDLKTEDKKKYALAKIQVLGLGYGCGWNKFITIAQQYEIDITEDDEKFALEAACDGKIYYRVKYKGEWVYASAPVGAKVQLADSLQEDLAPSPLTAEGREKVIFVAKENRRGETSLQVQTVYGQQSRALVRNFRESNPLIVALWNSMEEQLRGAVGSDLSIELPSGRGMTYRKVRQERRKFTDPDDDTKKIEKLCYTAEIGGRRYVLYGGLIVENCVSGDAEVLTNFGWCKLRDVRPDHLVWDGIELVSHHGLQNKGEQRTIEVHGVDATPEHLFLGPDGWRRADSYSVLYAHGSAIGTVRAAHGNAPQSVHEVFDLINCGPRRRFAVRAGANSPVLIAHNCTQAVARDVFAHNLLLVEDAGHRTLFTVHDEDVPEIPQDADATTITKLMSTTPPWIPGLPVGAETQITPRYKK